jgi:hypothetical protein
MIVLSDTGFHAAEGDPSNLKLCQRGEWQDRMLVEPAEQTEIPGGGVIVDAIAFRHERLANLAKAQAV